MTRRQPPENNSRCLFTVRSDISTEEALVNASELLASAQAAAHEHAFSLHGPRGDHVFGIAQLIENARLLVDTALERVSSPKD